MATSAAPTIFDPHPVHIKPEIIKKYEADCERYGLSEQLLLVDGGIVNKNTACTAYTYLKDYRHQSHTRKNYLTTSSGTTAYKKLFDISEKNTRDTSTIDIPDSDQYTILSLGTGHNPTPISNQRWGIIDWATYLPDLFIDGGVDHVNFNLDLLPDCRYMRYLDKDTPLPYISMTDNRKRTLGLLEKTAKDRLHQLKTSGQWDQLIDTLSEGSFTKQPPLSRL